MGSFIFAVFMSVLGWVFGVFLIGVTLTPDSKHERISNEDFITALILPAVLIIGFWIFYFYLKIKGEI